MGEKMTLLPCPFCGSDERPDLATAYPQPMNVVFAIECDDCGGRTAWCATSDLAERKWNRRHLTQPAQAVDVGAILAIIGLLRALSTAGEIWRTPDPNNPAVLNLHKLADKLTAALPKDSNGSEGV